MGSRAKKKRSIENHSGKTPAREQSSALRSYFKRDFLTSEKYLLLIVFIVAITVRLIYLNELREAPFFHHPVGDSKIYHERALEIAGGDLIGREAYFHSSPLYPYFLALVYRLFGANLTLIRFIQFLIGSINCMLIFLLARRIPGVGRGTAFLAGIFAALYGVLIFFNGDLLMITLVHFFVLLSILLLTSVAGEGRDSRIAMKTAGGGKSANPSGDKGGVQHSRSEKRLVYSILSGTFLGFAGLGKPNVLLFAPFALLWIMTGFERSFFKARWREAVLFTVGCCAAVFPITLRNYIISDDFVLVSSNAGINFFIGNNAQADGVFFLPPGSGLDNARLYLSSRASAENATGREHMKPSQVSSYWAGQALEFMRNNPGGELKLLLRKFLLFWNRYEIPNHHNFYFIGDYYASLLRKMLGRFVWIAPLALAGIISLAIRKRMSSVAKLYAGFICIYMISLIPFFITARYRLPVVPFLVLFAAVGVKELFGCFREKLWVKSAVIAGVLASSAVVVNLPLIEFDYGFTHAVMGTVYSDLSTAYPKRTPEYIEKAIIEYKKALELRPLSVDGHYNLGITCQRIGYFSRAVKELEAAVELHPDHLYAVKALEECRASLAETGDKIGEGVLPMTSFERGLQYSRKGNHFIARGHYERAIREDPHHAAAYSELGAIYYSEGDFDHAIGLFKKGLHYRPDHFVLNNNLAGAYYKRGDYAKAKSHWEKCLEIDPGSEAVKRQLSLVESKL